MTNSLSETAEKVSRIERYDRNYNQNDKQKSSYLGVERFL